MISISTIIDSRRIYYLSIRDNFDELQDADLKNWALFVIADTIHKSVLSEFIEICIDKDVLYVCAAGGACEEVHNAFDLNIVNRETEGRRMPAWYNSDEDVLMTTSDSNVEEGFWFCSTLAFNPNHSIDTVLVVNFTETEFLPFVEELARRIANGWFPPD